MDLTTSLSLKTFFDYGQNVNQEIHAEVLIAILTDKGSLPYYRSLGTTLNRSENKHLTLQNLINLYDQIMTSLDVYNSNTPKKNERQIAIAFEDLNFDLSNTLNNFEGNIDIVLKYYRLRDFAEVTIET